MNVSFVSLGCDKNRVNTEQMMALCLQAGITVQEDCPGSDVVVINTCGFIDSAKSEAIDTILSAAQLKEEGQIGKILVTGCLSQRYQADILEELPEIDGIMGTGCFGDIVPALEQVMNGQECRHFADINGPVEELPRVLSTPRHYAYLRIAEGCSNRCAYCVIPSLRGSYRSRRMEDILAEARALAEDGVQECIVIAQDITRYGVDLYGERRLPQLLRELCKLPFHWVRLHYLYPDNLSDELIDTIAGEEKICNYLDIPIQHCNDAVLKAMRRRETKAGLEALFARLRDRIPGVVLRTSLITGLPYEDEAAFEELCGFLGEQKLQRVGAFAYSPEEGTPAAKMLNRVDTEEAQRRAELVMEVQSQVMDQFNDSRMGDTVEVLCDGWDGQSMSYVGRSYAESPGIDGNIYFTSDQPVEAGDFVRVRITGAMDGELTGERTEECTMPMNTANKLTLARVFLIPVFLVIAYWGFPGSRYVALAVYIVACLTDLLDGYIARHYNQVSDFGKFADPLADKCLVMAALCWFVETGDMMGWVLAAVLLREFAVSGMRLIAVEKGRVIAAGWSGKVKTASTMVCICLILFGIPHWLNLVCQGVILVTTVYSGVEYFVKNWDVFSEK